MMSVNKENHGIQVYGGSINAENIAVGNQAKAIKNQTGDKSVSETFNNNLQGANIANFANKNQDNVRQQANQYNYVKQKQNIAEAAAEIQGLLKQLETTYPTVTEIDKLTVVAQAAEEIKKNPTMKSRVINALKAGGTEAFKEAVDHPLANVLVAMIQGWQDAE
ncbi:MAG: hypothetical protein HC862_26095 [Scytonema sp. RU_4_4]|nr:hypothetical protein [Scytonema sp. RU_4_4]NJR76480.1 hypothetical protein [Scytonema sp. CRU_2_7]